MNILENSLERVFAECNRHLARIEEASQDMLLFMPLDGNEYLKLTSPQVRVIDQFLFRFAKVQDAMGRKLFKLLLVYKSEDPDEVEQLSLIDMLNRLEKLKIIPDVEKWRKLRIIRNELAHQYDDHPEEMAVAINKVFASQSTIKEIYNNAKKYYLKIQGKNHALGRQ